MLQKTSLDFLRDLKFNNSKVWMDENNQRYQDTKNDIRALAEVLMDAIKEIDNLFVLADPKKSITRLNRDLRFAKDKTPYKTDYYIVLNKNGKNSPSAFYFLHIEPDNCFVGGGVYNPEPTQLSKIRKEIDKSYIQWLTIIQDKEFKKIFENGINNSGVLKRAPMGFSEDNPAIEYLKMKGFYTMNKLSDSEILSQDILQKIIKSFITTKPLVDFLNMAIEKPKS